MRKGFLITKAASVLMTAAMALSLCPAGVSAAEPTDDSAKYVLMNIPYAEFYEAEISNDVAVDGVTSATYNKPRTVSLAGGSYHVNSDGTDITGVTYPVKVDASVDLSDYKEVTDDDTVDITVTNRGTTTTTTLNGKDCLFENESYAYYELDEEPDYYKEVTMVDGELSFGKTTASVTESTASVSLSTESSYGDYQITVSDFDDFTFGTDTLYGVVIETTGGDSYGLRHIENIWRGTNLAFCTGFTDTVHNCPTSSAHYEEIMGEHISKIIYYTSKGNLEISTGSIYVPIKTDAEVSVEDAAVSAGQTTVTTTDLPEKFRAKYSVEGLEGVSVKDGVLSFDSETAKAGDYTLTVKDSRGTYASITADFSLYQDEMPVEYNGSSSDPAIVAKEGSAEDALETYIAAIKSVEVNGTSYSVSGRGAVTIINEDGTLATDASAFDSGDSFEITVKATGYQNLSFTYVTKDASESTYVLMNIPYAKFYANEVENDVDVDVFTSATKSKPRGTLADGSYHNKSDGSEISGVVYPVKVSAGVDLSQYKEVKDTDTLDITTTNRGTTSTKTYTGKECLFENPDYAYYTLSERPSYYKVATMENGELVFSASTGKVSKVSGAEATLSDESNYGDYQLSISGFSADTVNAVVLKTEEGDSYGLRHIENIWRVTNLAFCTGFTTTVHGCQTSSAHYEKIMGQNINEIVYYTTNGMYSISTDLYVPVKFEGSVSVEDAAVNAGETPCTIEGLPSDFEAEYTVDGLSGVSVEDGKLTYNTSTASKGEYTLVVTDASGKYASISADFELKTGSMPAAYDEDKEALVAADGASASEFGDFIDNITTVYVNGTAYSASGRGAVTIIKSNGALDTDAEPLAGFGSYEIKVVSTGYQSLTFTYENKAVVGEVSLSETRVIYNGKVQKPSVIVKDDEGETIDSSYYDVTYSGSFKNVGINKVIVTFKSPYSGTKRMNFKISPQSINVVSLTAASKSLVLKWTPKTTQITGYQIMYSANSKFTDGKRLTLKKNTVSQRRITGLQTGKTYYVKIRSYKTVNNVKYFSDWSKTYSAKVK